MCGRYAFYPNEDFYARFQVVKQQQTFQNNSNVTPGLQMPIIIKNSQRKIVMATWGITPTWKQGSSTPLLINAKAETLFEKPTFKSLALHNRCLIPANGFYEWKKEGEKKQPYFFHKKDNKMFSFAGIYDRVLNPDGSSHIRYVIITCPPSALVEHIHSRMPVILPQYSEKEWIQSPTPHVNTLLIPYVYKDFELSLTSIKH